MLSDRDYMNTNGSEGSSRIFKGLLIALPAVYVVQILFGFLFKSDLLISYLALSGTNFQNFYLWTPITYSFLHDTIAVWHILFNLLGFYIIGVQIVPYLKREKFAILYFGGVALGGILWLTFNLKGNSPLVGASAGICAMLMFFCCLFAERQISFLFIPIYFKAKHLAWGMVIITLLLFYLSLDRSTLQEHGTRVAHAAHLGGFLWGWFFYKVIYAVDFSWKQSRSSSIRVEKSSRKNKVEADAFQYKVNISSREHLREEVDRILDKINSKGFGSLTEEEKKTLDQARDILKH